MQTLVKSATKTHAITTEGRFTIIGEAINPTGRKRLAQALYEHDLDYVRSLARNQAAAGADLIDVNVGVPDLDEVTLLAEAVEAVAADVDLPLCIDTASPRALEAALAVAPGRPLVNSVTGERASLESVLPLVKEYDVPVIGLTMDDDGIPDDPESRLAIAERIINRAAQVGIPAADVLIDPLVLTVGADPDAASVTLRTVELVRQHFGANINLGATNVSFGLPERDTLNRAFLALGIRAGATSAITNPATLGLTIRGTELLLGRDEFAAGYIGLYRQQQNA